MIQRSLITLALCFSLGVGCTPRPSIKAEHTESRRLFPFGQYSHYVYLKQKDGETHSFMGAWKLEPERTLLIGLSPLGTTVFRLEDLLEQGTEQIKVEIYIEALKKHEGRIREQYQVLKPLWKVKLSDWNTPIETKSSQGGPGATIKVRTLDDKSIPRFIDVTHPKFELTIEMETYELD